MRTVVLTLVLVLVAASIACTAGVPPRMSYQGVLKEAGGRGVPDGDYDLTFRLYDTEVGGTPIWTETQTVEVTDGIFSAVLGTVNPLGLSFDRPYWLGVAVGEEAELTPRTELTAAPYSFYAKSLADSSVTEAKLADGAVTGAKIADGAVTGSEIAADAVTGAHIVDGTVELAADAVTEAKLGAGAVSADKIRALAVSTVKLGDLAVTGANLASAAVTSAKLDTSAVTTEKIQNAAVDAAKLKVAAVKRDKIEDAAVNSAKIEDGSVAFADIAQNGASRGQVMKWTGTTWAARNDSVGTGSGGGGGWTDAGTVVRLETASDSVGIGTGAPKAKLHVAGDARVAGMLTVGVPSRAAPDNGFERTILLEGATGTVVASGGFTGPGPAQNRALGDYSVVVVGAGAVVAGGLGNRARGRLSVVCGGAGGSPAPTTWGPSSSRGIRTRTPATTWSQAAPSRWSCAPTVAYTLRTSRGLRHTRRPVSSTRPPGRT